MATTKKRESIAAFRLELGVNLTTVGAASLFGGTTIQELGAGHAFPYIEISPDQSVDTIADTSVDGAAFTDVPQQAHIWAPCDNMTVEPRYIGMDRLLYWMFGYEDGGSSPQDLTGGIYSHLFELDSHERGLTAYRTAEQTALDYDAADFKNRYGVLALKRATNDHRYPFIICTGFTFSSEAGQPLKLTIRGLAWREDRGDYDSASWTFPAGMVGSENMILHRHFTVSLGESGSLVDIGVRKFEVSCDIPMTNDQDTESGLYSREHEMEGNYDVKCSIELSRHSVDTYLAARDAWTTLCAKFVATMDDYEFGLYLPELKLPDAKITADEVASHPLTFSAGYTSTNPFSTEIGDHDLIQNGPLFCIANNNNDTNEMRRE